MSQTSFSYSVQEFITTILAPQANDFASQARFHRACYQQKKAWIVQFDAHWVESNLGLFALGCLLSSISSFVLGKEMNQSVLSDLFYKGTGEAPLFAVAGFSGLLTVAALLTSYFAMPVFSEKYRNWLIMSEVSSGTQLEISRFHSEKRAVKSLVSFIAVATVTFSTIVLLACQRYLWQSAESGDDSVVNFALLLLTAVSFLFEVVAGEFAFLWVRRYLAVNRMEYHFAQYKYFIAQTADMDKKVALLWKSQMPLETSPLLLGDVLQCLRRASERSSDQDDYAEPFPTTESRAHIETGY